MAQAPENFPVADPGTQQDQLYIRDIEFLNYHINHDKWDWWRKFQISGAHRFEEDFDTYDTADWSVINTGAATEALTDMVNGVMLLTNAAANNDLCELLLVAEGFRLYDNYPLYAEIKFKLSLASASDFYFGLIADAQDAGYFAGVDDGVYFRKDDGDANIDFCTEYNTNITATDTTEDLAALTWVRLGFHWDGDGNMRYFVIRDSDEYILATGTQTTNIDQAQEMKLGFGMRNGTTTGLLLYVDYVMCVQRRYPGP